MVFAILEYCEDAELVLREQAHLDTTPSHLLYNSAPQAGNNLGFRHGEDTRRRMSQAHKGKQHTDNHRANVAAAKRQQTEKTRAKISAALKGRPARMDSIEAARKANIGRPLSAAHIEKIRAGNVGKARSPETRARMAAARRGKQHSEATLAKLRRPCSPETKAKIAEALRRRNAERTIKASQ